MSKVEAVVKKAANGTKMYPLTVEQAKGLCCYDTLQEALIDNMLLIGQIIRAGEKFAGSESDSDADQLSESA